MRQALFGHFRAAGQSAGSIFLVNLFRAALIGLPLVIGGATTQAQTLAALPTVAQPIEKNGCQADSRLGQVLREHPHPNAPSIRPSRPVIELTPADLERIVSVNRR